MPLLLAAALVGCAAPPSGTDNPEKLATSAWARASTSDGALGAWVHQEFPGKRSSRYRHLQLDGREVMSADSQSSVSMLRKKLRVDPAQLGNMRFSWKVPALIPAADFTDRNLDDSPVRVVLAFEGDRAKFSARDAMLSELAHALTGEPMPYATLMYVWSNQSATGTVLPSLRTSRIRKLVVQSGPDQLGRWLDYERDIRADFIAAFGEEPGALVSVGIMTDSDNTESSATAWYGPVRHSARGR